jgi:ABC-type phosphate transport system substrate-binding protein
VQATPALRWMGPLFQSCAQKNGSSLVLDEVPADHLDPAAVDVAFRWGAPEPAPTFTAVLGTDELVFVVNPANPLPKMTIDDARALFAGKSDSWSQVIKARCASCGPDFEGAVTVYVYPAGDDTRSAMEWAAAGPATVLAPDPAAVKQAVAAERYSLGYLPRRWLDSSLKEVAVEGLTEAQLRLPLTALAAQEPQGSLRAWLGCVQDGLK